MEILLDQGSKFTEDILKLSGIVNMIEKFAGSDKDSKLRKILSDELQERLQMWGPPADPSMEKPDEY